MQVQIREIKPFCVAGYSSRHRMPGVNGIFDIPVYWDKINLDYGAELSTLHHTYEKSHDESINEVYKEVEDDSDVDAVDKQEEKEYNAEIEGKEIVEDDSDEEVSSDADSEDDETVKYTDEDVSTLIGK